MEALFTSDFLRIYLYPRDRVLEVEWLDFACGDDFRAGISRALALASQHQVRHWISNNLLMRAVRTADQQWFEAEAVPQLLRLNLQGLAVVESRDAMNRMAVQAVRDNTGEWPFAQRHFDTVGQARQWVAGGQFGSGELA